MTFFILTSGGGPIDSATLEINIRGIEWGHLWHTENNIYSQFYWIIYRENRPAKTPIHFSKKDLEHKGKQNPNYLKKQTSARYLELIIKLQCVGIAPDLQYDDLAPPDTMGWRMLVLVLMSLHPSTQWTTICMPAHCKLLRKPGHGANIKQPMMRYVSAGAL